MRKFKKYDIRRSLYQIRKMGMQVPENIHELVKEKYVKRVMRDKGVTEREAQRRVIAAFSTIHIQQNPGKLAERQAVDMRGDLYYNAKKADKVRKKEIDAIVAAGERLEDAQLKIGRAEMQLESMKKRGNKGLIKIAENRLRKLQDEYSELEEAALGEGLFRTKKLQAPDVDLTKKYNKDQTDQDRAEYSRKKSFTPTKTRVREWIEQARKNMKKAIDKYPIPKKFRAAIKDKLDRMGYVELDKLYKSNNWDVEVFYDYDAGISAATLLDLMREIGIDSDAVGADPLQDAQDLLDALRDDHNTEIDTAEQIIDALGW